MLTIPDNLDDLYKPLDAVLARIREVVVADLVLHADAPAQVSLFAYDNDTVIVESFPPEVTDVTLVAAKGIAEVHDVLTGEVLQGKPVLDCRAPAAHRRATSTLRGQGWAAYVPTFLIHARVVSGVRRGSRASESVSIPRPWIPGTRLCLGTTFQVISHYRRPPMRVPAITRLLASRAVVHAGLSLRLRDSSSTGSMTLPIGRPGDRWRAIRLSSRRSNNTSQADKTPWITPAVEQAFHDFVTRKGWPAGQRTPARS